MCVDEEKSVAAGAANARRKGVQPKFLHVAQTEFDTCIVLEVVALSRTPAATSIVRTSTYAQTVGFRFYRVWG